MQVAIPLGVIGIVGVGIWIKRKAAEGVLNRFSTPFTDVSHGDESIGFELDEYDEGNNF